MSHHTQQQSSEDQRVCWELNSRRGGCPEREGDGEKQKQNEQVG